MERERPGGPRINATVDTVIDGNEAPRVVGPHISFSQMSMYLRCAKQYEFRYLKGLKEPPKLAMGIGRGGHSALEFNTRHKIRTGSDLAAGDLLDMASTCIDNETQDIEGTELTAKGEAKDRAIAAILVYRTRDAEAVSPAGAEIEFNLDLNVPDEEPIRIVNGKIDLITTDASVEDYKFVSQARSQIEVDLSPQLTLYGKVFNKLTGQVASKTGYRMFLPGSTRTPPDSRVVYRDPALMTPEAQERRFQRLAYQFRQVERGIRGEVFPTADDPKVCSWCGYRERCQSSLVNDFEAARLRGDN